MEKLLKATVTLLSHVVAISLLGCSGGGSTSCAPNQNAGTAHQDDTAYIQGLVSDGCTIPAGNYVTSSGIVLSGNNAKMVCAPETNITYIPTTHIYCVSDRAVLTNCDSIVDPVTHTDIVPRRIAAAIGISDTSFTASADASDLQAGDWLIVTEDDNSFGGVPVITDWAQVASVSGTKVNVVTPFRTVFPNLHTWKTSPCCGGLGFYKVVDNAASNVTISGCNIQVPDAGYSMSALALMTARDVTVDGTTVTNYHGQSLYSWLSKDVTITNSTGHGYTSGSEFGGSVDLSVFNTNFSSESNVGFAFDLGTAFFNFTDNTVSKSNNACFYLNDGVHDGIIRGTTCPHISLIPPTTNAIGIWSLGSQRVTITNNDLSAGGDGQNSTGLLIGPQPVADVPFPSTGNTISPNTFAGWSQNYSPNNQP